MYNQEDATALNQVYWRMSVEELMGFTKRILRIQTGMI